MKLILALSLTALLAFAHEQASSEEQQSCRNVCSERCHEEGFGQLLANSRNITVQEMKRAMPHLRSALKNKPKGKGEASASAPQQASSKEQQICDDVCSVRCHEEGFGQLLANSRDITVPQLERGLLSLKAKLEERRKEASEREQKEESA